MASADSGAPSAVRAAPPLPPALVPPSPGSSAAIQTYARTFAAKQMGTPVSPVGDRPSTPAGQSTSASVRQADEVRDASSFAPHRTAAAWSSTCCSCVYVCVCVCARVCSSFAVVRVSLFLCALTAGRLARHLATAGVCDSLHTTAPLQSRSKAGSVAPSSPSSPDKRRGLKLWDAAVRTGPSKTVLHKPNMATSERFKTASTQPPGMSEWAPVVSPAAPLPHVLCAVGIVQARDPTSPSHPLAAAR